MGVTGKKRRRSRYGVSFGGVEGGRRGKNGQPRPGNQGSRLGSINCTVLYYIGGKVPL
ncbi:hypothetical protein V8C26DRAFT_403865 [Trichoderma gracile]